MRRFDPALAAILLLALGIRLGYALCPHVSFGDESMYVWLAQSLLRGEFSLYGGRPELHFAPFFPIVLAILHAFAGWEAVTRVAYVAFGTLGILPAYALGRALYGARAARLAALLFAVSPAFTSTVLLGTTLSEPLYLFLLFSAFYFVYKASVGGGWAWHLAAGAFVSLAYLTRPEAFLHFVAAAAYLAVLQLARLCAKNAPEGGRAKAARAGAAGIAVFVAAFLVVASPYVLYLHRHTGRLSLTTKSTKTYTTTRALVHHDGEAFQRDTWGLDADGEVKLFGRGGEEGMIALLVGPYRHRVLSDVRANFSGYVGLFQKPHFFGLLPLLLAFLGLFATHWNRARLRVEIFNVWMTAPVAAALVFYVAERFFYPALLPSYFWVALGLECLSRWLRGSEFPRFVRRRFALAAVETVFVGALVAMQLSFAYRHFVAGTAGDAEVFAAASWLEQNTPSDAVIAATGPEVAFHAHRKWVPLPVAPAEDVARYVKARGGNYVCLRQRYALLRSEQRAEIFERPKDLAGLEFLAKVEGGAPASEWAFVVYGLGP